MKKLNSYLEIAEISAAMGIQIEDVFDLSISNYFNGSKPGRNRTKAQNKRRAKGLRGRKARKINFNKS